METKSIIEKLAQYGWTIRSEDLGDHDGCEYWLQRCERYDISADIERLRREGWLEPFNGGFRLSDEGRKAYLRSTDELGDGALIAPTAGDQHD